jgi:apolipoprotein N-acyltransferase
MRAFAGVLFWVVVALAAFHGAYSSARLSFLIVLFLFALLQLAQGKHWRLAFYPGLAVGLLIAAFQLGFFWQLFSGGAVALWVVYAFWIGLFVALARLSLMRLGPKWGWFAIPFLWTGLEYFRSELYYLRFSWLNVGYAFSGAPWQRSLGWLGVYGAGFLVACVAAGSTCLWRTSKARSLALLTLGTACLCVVGAWSREAGSAPAVASVRVAGMQLELPDDFDVAPRLNDLIRVRPDAELVVLSEYTFEGPVPESIHKWCRENRRYLVVGGKEKAANGGFYNTAFVIGPDGQIVFRQVKAVPIQFFDDGRPAPEQKVWESPWGKIGICICYDLSYARVTDRLVQLGAEALIVPTMDMADWGSRQHELHALIAPARALEYGVPIFRLASSGISQAIHPSGRVMATAPYPGEGAVLAGTLELRGSGHRPLDRWLAPFAVGVTGVLIVCFLIRPPRIAATSNIQHPASNVDPAPFRQSMDVGCSMLDVGCSSRSFSPPAVK